MWSRRAPEERFIGVRFTVPAHFTMFSVNCSMSWFLYILRCKDESFYTGITWNLKRRIQEHNSSGKKYTTRKNGKWILVYAEAYRSKEDAYLREKRLKSHGSGKIELFKRIKNSLLDPKSGEGRS